MVHEENTLVNIKLDEDLIFKSLNEYKKIQDLIIDETIDKEGILDGPDAASLLGLAIVSCLSATFIFCLNKRNLTIEDLKASANISFKKIGGGLTRIDKIQVNIIPKTQDEEVLKRIKICTKELKDGEMFFEKACIITPSVRDGIDISVNVEM
jgi:uncharacterized OsmC-like protein